MEKIFNLIIEKRATILVTFIILFIGSLFLIPQVGINYNLSSYLPKDSDTSKAINIMEKEFGLKGVVQVMVKDISKENAIELKERIEALSGVDSVTFSEDTQDNYKGNKALFVIAIDGDDYSENANVVIDGVRRELSDYDIYMNGSAINNRILNDAITTEIPVIALIALVFIVVVLLMTATSWIEPLLFLFIAGFAIVMNMGTNIIFGEISFITAAIAALLQLALSMDYSIMLLHRYREELEIPNIRPAEAMEKALQNSFAAIWSSSFTTIAGILTMVVMSFTIGKDIGLVMGKGIFISVICVFLLMPNFILLFEKILNKTKKKSLKFTGKHLASFSYMGRKIIPFFLIVLIIGSYFIQTNQLFSYAMKFDNPKEAPMIETFGENNQFVAIFPNTEDNSEEKQQQFIATMENYQIDNEKAVKSIMGYTNTAGQKITASEAATLMNTNPIFVNVLFGLYAFDHGQIEQTQISPYNFIQFLSIAGAENEMVGNMFGENTALLGQLQQGLKAFNDNINAELTQAQFEQYKGMYSVINSDIDYTDMMNAIKTIAVTLSGQQVSIDIDDSLVKAAYVLYFNEVGRIPDFTLTSMELIGYASNLIENNNSYLVIIDDSMKEMLTTTEEQLSLAEGMFNGENYSRILITTNLPAESNEIYQLVDYSREQIKRIMGGNAYIVGDVTATYDMKATFSDELLIISALTIVTLLTIVAIAFRSLSIPFILVMTIQGAFWVNISFSTLGGTPVFFLAYIIAQSLQMGATIDYGILFTSNYVEARRTKNIQDALSHAFAMSLPTIFTSATILFSTTMAIALISTQSLLTSICGTLSTATIVATIFVLFGLPATLAWMDRIIEVTTFKAKFLKSADEDDNRPFVIATLLSRKI